ncbi:tryptophan synthase subunit alpha [Campylobacter suis]|uniref:Tryptophan synthase alpha chain n=1 Tax=Campylobacter suis TaxID=2790657 RepID=A0ABN7K195_9BACT|nr:tryptophan synthase subunit alpha [Campylobacter suis]CAD7286242.1 Tryptophan synthase alpha chain [Campylobacter suis]
MDKISLAFRGEKANIGYIVGGYPSVEHTKEFLSKLDQSCLDMLEIGIPYSDPLADGKTIAKASFKAYESGLNTDSMFEILSECKGRFSKPVVFLVYFNLVFSYGIRDFIKRAKECGVSGMIVPDLPSEESEEIFALCESENFALIPLISVTSGDRVGEILKRASGFVYAVGAIGVSGSKRASVDRLKELVKTAKNFTDLPVCVGFGVRTKEDANEVKSYADGAIIGTAIVELTDKFSGDELMQKVGELF